METLIPEKKQERWLDKPLASFLPRFTIEHLVIAFILILAVISRFYNVGLRVMSHDEVNHVVPSYELYTGVGYVHNPVTHGPLQFHLVASSYFLFGDSDFSSRIPSAIFSIATIAFVIFGFRRYLGKTGSLLAGIFFLISPYMLFYGRYTRNESFVAFFGVVMLWAVLHYLEQGKRSTLIIFTAVLALHFATKETSFIYTAILLIFLAILFIREVLQKEWKSNRHRSLFTLITAIGLILIGLTLTVSVIQARGTAANAETAGGLSTFAFNNQAMLNALLVIMISLAGISVIAALVIMFRGLGWQAIKHERSFDLLLLTITMVLPQLVAIPISILGWNPLDYSQTGLIHTSIVLAIVVLIAAAFGLAWNPTLWLKNAALFYSIFTVLYTTFFTNGEGFFTGMVGALGYWLSQQGVNRGEQPLYFYALLQIPMYEYLPAIGTILAFIVGIKHRLFSTLAGYSPAHQPEQVEPAEQLPLDLDTEDVPTRVETPKRVPVLALLVYWSVMSLIAYSIAGEKMPWITVHIALPMLLAAGWGIGYFIDSIPWRKIVDRKGIIALLLLPVFLVSLGGVLGSLLGANPPFAGTELAQLEDTSTFLFSLAAAVLSGWGILKLLENWEGRNILRLLCLTFFGILSVLTARSAFQASYINYDNAKEFLVYAHAASGPKEVLKQVEEISERTVGGKNIKVAYIGDALYPYWWYFRDYPNKTWFNDKLTKDLLNYPVVIGDDVYISQVKSILKDDYVEYNYKRLWWPMQDYFNLSATRIWSAISDPQMRQALFNIWANKDYTLYATLTNNPNLTLETWQPSAGLHLYVKKDIINQIWNYGTLPAPVVEVQDPYQNSIVSLTPDKFFGQSGQLDGQFNSPRGIATAADGSIYVVDSRNNRIQHFSSDGTWLQSWGTYASVDAGAAPGGTFNEPWGIAIGPDGSVYVADTWNYRIQKFTADGKFITMWGKAGQGDTPEAFWGPRGLAVDAKGNVFVTDTGNKRVVVFTSSGKFITQFGTYGMNDGELDEPVGLTIDQAGNVYVADTWNQRIQVFAPNEDGTEYKFSRSWEISGWTSDSVDNKPFLAIDASGNIFAVDPDNYRVLEFDSFGKILRVWGGYSSGIDGFGLPSALAVDASGGIWISDAANNYILHYSLPAIGQSQPGGMPELPVAGVALTYNAVTGYVENSFQQAVYRLDAETNEWVPVIPDAIQTAIEPGTLPEKDTSGNWIIKDSNDDILFQWDAAMLIWVAANPAEVTTTN